MRPRRTLTAAIVLATLLSACSSTSKDGGPLAASGGETEDASTGTRDAGSPTARRRARGRALIADGGRVDLGASEAGANTGRVGTVKGVTSKEIRIGYGTQKDADQAAAGFGLNAVFGDVEAQARAIVNDINERGGVLGRKLTLVVHDERTASDLQSPDGTAASQCEDWTKDRPVFAGVNIVGARNISSFFSCMAKA